MKLIDGLKIKGGPAEIPDCSREDLPQLFLDLGFKVGAEVGTAKGVFAEFIAKAGLKLYCIDPYLSYSDYYGGTKESQDNFDNDFERAKNVLAPYDCTFVKKTSMDALVDFADESLDFVYLDGNHAFKYVAEDIFEWSKKVRKGGIIAGHDYFYAQPRVYDEIHVKYVVDAYTRAYRIRQWYVIGRRERVEGERREAVRSFFWIKN